MGSISSTDSDRRRLTASIKQSLRALSIQLSLLNHQVGAHAASTSSRAMVRSARAPSHSAPRCTPQP